MDYYSTLQSTYVNRKSLFTVGFSCMMFFSMSIFSPLFAQTSPTQPNPSIDAFFSQYINNPMVEVEALKTAEKSPVWTANICHSAEFEMSKDVLVYSKLLFNADGQLTAGAWKQQFRTKGCGQSLILNTLTEVTALNSIAMFDLVPGTTLADPVLAKTAKADAIQAVPPGPSGCTQAYVADTNFTGYGSNTAGQAGVGPPWQEVWTIDQCGQDETATLLFTPTTTGTTISVVPN